MSQPLPDPDEVHSYFPEWADRPLATGLLYEADHNSYLAGGYSEVFGYQSHAGEVSAFPLLRGEPEANGLWHVEIGCLHPGYPECARPQDRGLCDPGLRSGSSDTGASVQIDTRHRESPGSADYRIIRVGQSQPHRGVLGQLELLLSRWRVYMSKRRHLLLR